jgi:3'-phosphoadenosine 5'-phosphosulfate sulfotransferase (PAPS reductase)/FAD synthetase
VGTPLCGVAPTARKPPTPHGGVPQLALFETGPLRADLAVSDDDVRRLSPAAQQQRLAELMEEGFAVYEYAVEHYIEREHKTLAATVVLFSGGGDSTCLTHLFRHTADLAAHCNTTIGIGQTRRFVRATARHLGLALMEHMPPLKQDRYRSLVLSHGFPGPGQTF